MSTLTDFLLARIAEDEAVARAAGPMPSIHALNEESALDYQAHRVTPVRTEHANNLHVHRWAPARVLAECEAKRQIIGYAAPADGPGRAWYQFTLLRLALPYADHPDYDEAWRP